MNTSDKASKLKELEGQMFEQFTLMNDALVEGNDHAARFHDGIRFSLYAEWTRLKEAK
jgi:hypothetical protein